MSTQSAEDTRIDPSVEAQVSAAVNKIFEESLKPTLDMYLADISFRIRQLREESLRGTDKAKGTVFAEDLNLPGRVFLTGYTVTNNSPAAGSIAWADLHVVYNGQDTLITNGSTANRYIWWSPATTPTALQSSNTKPVLAQGEVLIFMNNGGVAKVMLSDTNQSLPGVVGDGAVDTTAILANAVTSVAIADGAVTAAQIGANAVTGAKIADAAIGRSGQLSANVVTTTAIADSAVTSNQIGANAIVAAKLADGAIARTAQMGTGVVATSTIAANAVDSTKVADGAVARTGQLGANVVDGTKVADNAISRAGQLAANVVGAGKIADSAINRSGILSANVVTSGAVADNALSRASQLAANVVTNAAIANNAVQSGNIVSGAVGATKLDILRHVLY